MKKRSPASGGMSSTFRGGLQRSLPAIASRSGEAGGPLGLSPLEADKMEFGVNDQPQTDGVTIGKTTHIGVFVIPGLTRNPLFF
ncbi:MAG: hypothetical protein ACYS0I_19780 [Planctomycetota bacterium]|jgi:hypothetical protein